MHTLHSTPPKPGLLSRDQQLKEKSSLVKVERQRQQMLDAEQEAERVAAVQMYEVGLTS